MSRGISLDQLRVSYIISWMWSMSPKLELSRINRLFHSTRMRGSPGASVTKYRKQTSYYGFRISWCHDFLSSRTLSISVHSLTQASQMKPIGTFINAMPNLNVRDDWTFPHWLRGSNSTRFDLRDWTDSKWLSTETTWRWSPTSRLSSVECFSLWGLLMVSACVLCIQVWLSPPVG